MPRRYPPPPKRLAPGGLALWRAIVRTGPLRADHQQILEDAVRESDLIDELVEELRGAPKIVLGSQHQQVANPLISEIRQHRAVLSSLLRALELPKADNGAAELAHEAREGAMALARARWSRTAS
jgi:hypothetical protein